MKRMQKEFIIATKNKAMKEFESGKYVFYQAHNQEVFFHKDYRQDRNHVEETLQKLPKHGLWWVQK